MRVLYLVSVGQFGGATRSLGELLLGLRAKGVIPTLVGQRGTAALYFRSLGFPYSAWPGMPKFANSKHGYYHGLRWLVLLRELCYLPFGMIAAACTRIRNPDIDIIHCNEIHDLGIGLLLKFLYNRPLVLHVRSTQRPEQSSRRSKLIMHLVRRNVDAVIAIDDTVRLSLPQDIPVHTIHNSLDVSRADALSDGDVAPHIPVDSFVVGFVGNLLRTKGVVELIEAVAVLRRRGVPVHLMIVGGSIRRDRAILRRLLSFTGLQQDVGSELGDIIAASGISELVTFAGHTENLARYYRRFDVLAFPSHLDAPGRPVFEAALFGKPSVVCITTPTADTFIDRVTGLAVSEKDSVALADALEWLARNEQERLEMGRNAYSLARDAYSVESNANKVHRLYLSLASPRGEQARSSW